MELPAVDGAGAFVDVGEVGGVDHHAVKDHSAAGLVQNGRTAFGRVGDKGAAVNGHMAKVAHGVAVGVYHAAALGIVNDHGAIVIQDAAVALGLFHLMAV